MRWIVSFAGAALAAQEPVDFRTEIAPLLRARCLECHGPDKQKGDLRLDARDGLFGGDEDLWTVVPRKPGESELLRRVLLPIGDDDAMPKVGARLTREQVGALRRWIAEGAAWPDGFRIEPPPFVDPHLPSPASAAELSRRARAIRSLEAKTRVASGPILAPRALGDDTRAVELTVFGRRNLGPAVPDLDGLEPFVVRLDLARCRVGDDVLARLAELPWLRAVDLAGAVIGRDGLAALGRASRLEVVNLTDVAIGAAELEPLLTAPALRRVYLWGTAVADEDLKRLASAHPNVSFERGAAADAMLEHVRDLADVRDEGLVGARFGSFDDVEWIDDRVVFADRDFTLIRWWTDTCPHCAATLPALDALAKRTDGLRVIGMYHPKPPREVSGDAVRAAAKRLGFGGVLAQDPEWKLLAALQARGMPRRATSVSVLVDRRGFVRWIHPGPRIHGDPDGHHPSAAAALEALEATVRAH